MHRVAFAITIALTAATLAVAQTNPDFSGTWKMDPTRSESAHQDVPIGSVSLVITQTADEFRIETLRSRSKSSDASNEVLTFHLDGKESTNPGNAEIPVKLKAHWDGPRFIAETERQINGSTVTTMQVFQLSPNSKEITIQKTLTVQHGYQDPGPSRSTGSGRDVFTKTR